MENVTIAKRDYDALVKSLRDTTMELRQMHVFYQSTCQGRCPAMTYIEEAENALATV